MDKQYTYTKEETKDKEIKLVVKVESAKFLEVKAKMFNKLKETVKLPGFRPGKAPQALVEAHISEKVYNETLNKLIPEIASEILDTEKYTPMNQISYELVKMSDAEGVEFKASFINYPEVKLGDMKKIKVKKEEKPVTDKDVDAEVQKILDYYTEMNQASENKEALEEGKPAAKDDKKAEKKSVAMTDETVKALGIGFETVKDLKEQVKKEIEAMNARDIEAKWLQTILDEAIKASKISVPQALVTQSVASREAEYTKKLEELKLKADDFLKMQNTSIEKLRTEWANEATKKFAEELLLLEVIKAEKLTVTQSEITAEIDKVTDAKLKGELDTPEGKRYIVTVLLQQKAIEWLREQVQK